MALFQDRYPFVVVDIETTGLGFDDEILQCSIIDPCGNVLFNGYFRPEKVLAWPEAEAVNGISPADVADCPTFSTHSEKVMEILNRASCIVGYNHVKFDMPFLGQYNVFVPPDTVFLDMMLSFDMVAQEYRSDGQLKWQKLTKAAEFFNFPFSDFHNSVMDCFATLHVFYCLYQGSVFLNEYVMNFHNALNNIYRNETLTKIVY